MFREPADHGNVKPGITMATTVDGSKVHILYSNDFGDVQASVPGAQVMIRTFENGALGPEVSVTDQLDSRLYAFAVAGSDGSVFLAHNKVLQPRVMFASASQMELGGSEVQVGFIDENMALSAEGVPGWRLTRMAIFTLRGSVGSQMPRRFIIGNIFQPQTPGSRP
jgi:hypothetical protein